MDKNITPKYDSDEKKEQCCQETNAQLKRIADALEDLVKIQVESVPDGAKKSMVKLLIKNKQ
jgi:hypothetical protein